MGFAPYFGYNGKFHGDPSKIKMSIEDKEQNPAYDYIAAIDSQVEFRVTPSVIRRLSRDHMPAWGMKSYLDYFSDQKSGIILFLRVYKISEAIDQEYIKKGSKGSSQILKLYDQSEEETCLSVEIEYPVISENKFSYIRDEIIHLLKIENTYIAGYDQSAGSLKSLQERINAEHLVEGTRHRAGAHDIGENSPRPRRHDIGRIRTGERHSVHDTPAAHRAQNTRPERMRWRNPRYL